MRRPATVYRKPKNLQALPLWPLIMLVLVALSLSGLVLVSGEIGRISSEIDATIEAEG